MLSSYQISGATFEGKDVRCFKAEWRECFNKKILRRNYPCFHQEFRIRFKSHTSAREQWDGWE